MFCMFSVHQVWQHCLGQTCFVWLACIRRDWHCLGQTCFVWLVRIRYGFPCLDQTCSAWLVCIWLYPQLNTPGTHFCQRLTRLQGHSAAGRIVSMKNSNDTIGNPESMYQQNFTAPTLSLLTTHRMDLTLPLLYSHLSFQPDPTEHDMSTRSSSSIQSLSSSIRLGSKGNTRFLSSLSPPVCSSISSHFLKRINMYLTSGKRKGKVHTRTGHKGPEGK